MNQNVPDSIPAGVAGDGARAMAPMSAKQVHLLF